VVPVSGRVYLCPCVVVMLFSGLMADQLVIEGETDGELISTVPGFLLFCQ
jgi:hypothetical protein